MIKKETTVSLPELGMIAATRVLLGMGIGLMLGERLSAERRNAVGFTLIAVGVLSTIPLGVDIFSGRRIIDAETDDITEAA